MQDSELRHWLQKQLGINPSNLQKYRMAITTQQYEVLEFFGDSVLGFIVAEYLVGKYDFIDQPGWFTRVKAKLVKNKNLAQVAQRIGIASIAIIPSTSSREHISDKVVANMLEALIGAVYLDYGLPTTQKLITRLLNLEQAVIEYTAVDSQQALQDPRQARQQIEAKIKQEMVASLQQKNPISALQEFLAKKGESPPQYQEVERIGESHAPQFTVEASCHFQGETLLAEGTGKKLKQAKKEAAQNLLGKVFNLFQSS